VKSKKKFAGKSKMTLVLRLYVAGQTPKSLAAISNLKKICSEHFEAKCKIELIDLLKKPALARDHQIIAIPTLVRSLPIPISQNHRGFVGH
jgi:circadian clock protein KaiB